MCLATLGCVLRVEDGDRGPVALVATDGGTHEASLLLHPDARPGDHVLVHTGYVVEVVPTDLATDAARLRGRTEGAAKENPPC